MAEVSYEMISASNFSQNIVQTFHRPTKNIVSWQSTEFGVVPIEVLFKLEVYTFVTELYMTPKRFKFGRLMEVLVSEDNHHFTSVAKVYDFNDAVRVEISSKCRYIKMVVLEKQHGKPASIDFLRIYGHPYYKYQEDHFLHSQQKEKVDEILISHGMNRHKNWEVDEETMVTLTDMSKLRSDYAARGEKDKLQGMIKDFDKVMKIGETIQKLEYKKKYLSAKEQFQQIKDVNDQILMLKQKRNFYDEKYQTSRFQEMIALDDLDNRHDEILKDLLIGDKARMEEEKRRREEEARLMEEQINNEFDNLDEEDEWWKQNNQLDQIEQEVKPQVQKKSKVQKKVLEEHKEQQFKFRNQYVYNQGDADMEAYIKPLLGEFGGQYLADPELLRRYEQMEYLDVLGARIWISAHSENWRQRAAAVQAVLNFSQNSLPERYKDGKTKNLFLALMEFARINAEDKVLQIYYTSLKIMTVALAPPICGEDVPPSLINKSIQKFLSILVDKISEMNARAKQISLKTLITIFKHPVADLNIAINECLRICKQQLNVKFIPIDKQNPRIVLSRLEIIGKIMNEFRLEKRKIEFKDILTLLIEGALFHSNSEVREAAVKRLEDIYRYYESGTIQWYKNIKGLKPNISAQIEQKLKIH